MDGTGAQLFHELVKARNYGFRQQPDDRIFCCQFKNSR